MGRFVLFGGAVMQVLALEVEAPSSKERKKWAADILRELTGQTWVLIGMLADFADD